MKKTIFFAIVLILTMGSTNAFTAEKAVKSDTEILAVPMSENKVMEDEVINMNERLEEIRDMEKSELSAKDKKVLKKELKKNNKGLGTIYIGGATLVLLIILIAILV